MLKHFSLKLGEAGAAARFDIHNLDINNEGPAIAITASALLRVSLLFAWLR